MLKGRFNCLNGECLLCHIVYNSFVIPYMLHGILCFSVDHCRNVLSILKIPYYSIGYLSCISFEVLSRKCQRRRL